MSNIFVDKVRIFYHFVTYFDWVNQVKVKNYTRVRWLWVIQTELIPSWLSFPLTPNGIDGKETYSSKRYRHHSITSSSFFLIFSHWASNNKESCGNGRLTNQSCGCGTRKLRSRSNLSFGPENPDSHGVNTSVLTLCEWNMNETQNNVRVWTPG